jgi:hypothetical protein
MIAVLSDLFTTFKFKNKAGSRSQAWKMVPKVSICGGTSLKKEENYVKKHHSLPEKI